MQFIYCLDKETKIKLISKGYEFLKEELMQDKLVWIFVYKPDIQFDVTDSVTYFVSSKLLF